MTLAALIDEITLLTAEITRRVHEGSLPPHPVRFTPTPEGQYVPIAMEPAGDRPCDACDGGPADILVGEVAYHYPCYAIWVEVYTLRRGREPDRAALR